MPKIETYGGSCPECQKHMLQKGPAYHGGFVFDACPWCGFAYGEISELPVKDPSKIWKSIFDHYGCETRKELIEKYEFGSTEPDPHFENNVFAYSAKNLLFPYCHNALSKTPALSILKTPHKKGEAQNE